MTVGKYRKELQSTVENLQSLTRTGRDGRTINTANIGRRGGEPEAVKNEAAEETQADDSPPVKTQMTTRPTPPEPADDPACWDTLVIVERPRCPRCQSANLLTIRSQDQGDGSVLRKTRCRRCSYRFDVVIE